MEKIIHSQQFLQKRKMFVFMPIIGVPFLLLGFYSLKSKQSGNEQAAVIAAGFNPVLPSPKADPKKDAAGKVDYYRKADEDSARKKSLLQQDPYHRSASDSALSGLHTDNKNKLAVAEDAQADALLQKLDHLQQSLQQPPADENSRTVNRTTPVRAGRERQKRPVIPAAPEPDTVLDKLKDMLDAIKKLDAGDGSDGEETKLPNKTHVEKPPAPDTVAANSLPAVVESDQVLVAGSTIALRLEASARISGAVIPKDQLVYGVASIQNDRMMISINSIRKERSIYFTALQVYDMDGLPGIHIPGDLGRETAKQSADQAIGSMNITNLDPSVAAQATNAGIVTARSLLSRKVRITRVAIRAGYHVLLRNTKASGGLQVIGETMASDSVKKEPECVNCVPFIFKRVREGGVELVLKGVYLQGDAMFFALQLSNLGPIDFIPAYTRWSMRDRRQAKRTAIQDLELRPLLINLPERVAGDSSREMMAAFTPFALPKDKELVLQVAEQNGARVLVMAINHTILSHTKKN